MAARITKTVKRELLVIEALQKAPATLASLAGLLIFPSNQVRYTLASLHQQHRVHISGWVASLGRHGVTRFVPLYVLGPGSDAPPPNKRTARGLDFMTGGDLQSICHLWRRKP